MMKRRATREVLALLPWVAAAMIWFLLVSPMRADQETRLNQQSRLRRDRVKAEHALRDTRTVTARIANALASVCRGSNDPAALRQRAVAASHGLALSPFSLTVAGGPEVGAVVEASGPPSALLELLRRLGDPARGTFLRAASLRERSGAWSLSATTGVFESLQGGVIPAAPPCAGVSDPAPADPEASAPKTPRKNVSPKILPRPSPPEPVGSAPEMEAPPATPFTLVGFLVSGGKTRVSLLVNNEVRVVSAGDVVEGWKCVSVDRDEGAAFISPLNVRVVVKARPSDPGR